jgi:hypothetical protein
VNVYGMIQIIIYIYQLLYILIELLHTNVRRVSDHPVYLCCKKMQIKCLQDFLGYRIKILKLGKIKK